ncbi:MAG: heterodisulfide reductase subunit A-like protein, partial [bacterium]
DDVEKLVVAGCDPEMQKKMFRDAFEKVGFEKSKHIGVDIRNMTTEQAVEAIKAVL